MAVQIPVLVVTSGVRELARLSLALARSVGLGAKTAVRITSRKVGKEMVAISKNIARETSQQFAPASGFLAASRFSDPVLRSSFKVFEQTKQDKIFRVINWFIPDWLFSAFGPGPDVDAEIAAEHRAFGESIRMQRALRERSVDVSRRASRVSFFEDLFGATGRRARLQALQRELEDQITREIFG